MPKHAAKFTAEPWWLATISESVLTFRASTVPLVMLAVTRAAIEMILAVQLVGTVNNRRNKSPGVCTIANGHASALVVENN